VVWSLAANVESNDCAFEILMMPNEEHAIKNIKQFIMTILPMNLFGNANNIAH
jgi:hypothetical protein